MSRFFTDSMVSRRQRRAARRGKAMRMESLENRIVLDYGSAVIASNPLTFLRFNEGAGNIQATDASGHGNVGQFNNGATRTANGGGVTGATGDYAADFFGPLNNFSNNNVTIPSAAGGAFNSISTAVTISFWAFGNPAGLPSQTNVVQTSGVNLNIHLPWSDSNIYWDTGGCCDPGLHRINTTPQAESVFEGAWTHWAFVKNGNFKAIYRNGVQILSGNNTAVINAFNNFVIGTDVNGNNQYQGRIDDFAVWNRGLSQVEIQGQIAGVAMVEWDGGAGDNNYFNPINWVGNSNIPDSPGEAAFFGNTAAGTVNMFGGSANTGGVFFGNTAGNYNLTGGNLTVPQILNLGTRSNTVSANVKFSGSTIQNDTAGTTLTVSGNVDIAGVTLTAQGVGDITISGNISGGDAHIAGLKVGRLAGDPDLATPNPGNEGTQLGINYGQTSAVVNPSVVGNGAWADNTTFVYTGEVFDADGIFSFGENIDDRVRLRIKGIDVLSNDNWNQPTSSASTANGNAAAGATNNFGASPSGDGWYPFELRMSNGGGGAGAVGGNGWAADYGIGFSSTGTANVDGGSFIKPIDPGTGTLFRQTVAGGHIIKNGSGTLRLSGNNTYQGDTTINGGTVIAASNNALGATGKGTSVPAGTILRLEGGVVVPEPLTVAGRVVNGTGSNSLSGSIVLGASATLGTTVGSFTGGDTGEGADFDGSFLWAVNMGGPAAGLVGGANFISSEPAPAGMTYSAPNIIGNWHAPNYGSTTNDNNLETVMQSIRWNGGPVTMDLGNLIPGHTYKLQLLYAENCCDRGFDISVEGTMIVDNFNIPNNQGGIGNTARGVVVTHTFVAGDNTLNILQQGPAPFGDNNPTISGITVEDVTPPTFESLAGQLTIAGSVDITNSNVEFTGAGNFRVTGDIFEQSGAGGLNGRYYAGIASNGTLITPISNLEAMTPTTTKFTPRVDFGVGTETIAGDGTVLDRGGSDFNIFGGIGVNVGNDNIAGYWSGWINIPAEADYRFTTRSDDGSVLYIDGVQIVFNDFDQGMTNRDGTVHLTAGSHAIKIASREGNGGAGMQASWERLGVGGFARRIIEPAVLFSEDPAIVRSVTKSGSGTLTYIGAKTYPGPTTIAAGTFAGTGSVVSNVTVNAGATFLPGDNGPGTFTFNGNVILQPGSFTVSDITSGGTDLSIANGTVTINNAVATLNYDGSFRPADGQEFILLQKNTPGVAFGTFLGAPQGGQFVFGGRLWEIDYQGGDGNDISVIAVNRPPTADAGGPYSINEGDDLILDASASTDPDGDPIVDYTWDINGDGIYGDAVGVNPTVTWNDLVALGIDNGTQTYTMYVSVRASDVDDSGDSPYVDLEVVNVGPTATISGPSSTAPNVPISLDFSALDPSPVDQAGTFSYDIDWGDGTGIETVSGADLVNASHTYAALGTYDVTVTVTDQDGDAGPTSDPFTVSVVPVTLDGDDIIVGGTDLADKIAFSLGSGGAVVVTYNGVKFGPFAANANTRLIANGGGGNDNITVSNVPYVAVFDGGADADYLAGGTKNDTLRGGDANDRILGGLGDDFLDGGEGADSMDAGAGNDSMEGGGGNDTMIGGLGNNTMNGGAGNDNMTGNTGIDIMRGNDGNDTMTGGLGNDILVGGLGNDRLLGVDGNDVLIGGSNLDSIDGGNGDDLVVAGNAANAGPAATDAALLAILTTWQTNKQNGVNALGTITQDGDKESLIGGAGVDWFYMSIIDVAKDFKNGTDKQVFN